jgi:hypothetical protein
MWKENAVAYFKAGLDPEDSLLNSRNRENLKSHQAQNYLICIRETWDVTRSGIDFPNTTDTLCHCDM